MANENDQQLVKFAEGRGGNLGKGRNFVTSWKQFKDKRRKPFVTPETRKAFDDMPEAEKATLKGINGWTFGAQFLDNRRKRANLLDRNLLTLDIDYAPASLLEDIEFGLIGIHEFEAFYHSSRRHRPDSPRVRVFAPLSREVTVDEYIAIVRYMGWLIDHEMKLVDFVSYRSMQMMYNPTCSRDDEKHYFAYEQRGKTINPDDILRRFNKQFGDWKDLANHPKSPTEHTIRMTASEAEDPRTKKGIIGAFCRTYDVFGVMEKFIPGVYIPGDEHSAEPRYTYAGATTSNGAIVYDDGLFLFSHHGTDPCEQQNVNAWDLVRIHLFGDTTGNETQDTKITDRESFKKMVELAENDGPTRGQQRKDKWDNARAFDDVEEEEDDDGPTRPDLHEHGDRADAGRDEFDDASDRDRTEDAEAQRAYDAYEAAFAPDPIGQLRKRFTPHKAPATTENWVVEGLEYTQNQELKPSMHNIATILIHDKRLRGACRFNDFTQQLSIARPIKTRLPIIANIDLRDPANGDRWEKYHDITIRGLLEHPRAVAGDDVIGYAMPPVPERNVKDGLDMAAKHFRYHPVREYLLSLKWDGKKRIDDFLIRYINVPDTDYHRQISALPLIASVTRIFEPGHKFDCAVIIQGPQGVGKSTLIRALYGNEWFGELHCDLGEKQKVAEEIGGKWGIELPELSAFHKSDHNKAKAFMSRTHDDVRMAYDARLSNFPRVCVCWGTTNDGRYLKDSTGNRRWWPAVMDLPKGQQIDMAGIRAERDQLWAEALVRYVELRKETPLGDLFLDLRGAAAMEEASRVTESVRAEEVHEDWAEKIIEWLETPVTLPQLKAEINLEPAAFGVTHSNEGLKVVRTTFIADQAMMYALHKNHGVANDNMTKSNLTRAVDLVLTRGWQAPPDPNAKDGGTLRSYVMGKRARWMVRDGASFEDHKRGYLETPTGTKYDDL